jgi:multidrug efflux pump subunit AcrA (membrane-fusion protein)
VKYQRVLIILLSMVFVVACSKNEKTADGIAEQPLVRDVQLAVVEPQGVEEGFEAVGTVKAKTMAVVSSQTAGTIVAVRAREGDRVSRGQSLVDIDDRDLRAELEGAQAAVDEATRAIGAAESAVIAARGQQELAATTFKRYEPLAAKGSVTPQEFDEVSAKYRIANAELERAEENLRVQRARKKQAEAKVSSAQTRLGFTKIAAPFDGVVTAKTAEVGALASPGSPLMTIEHHGLYRLEVQVGESRLGGLKLGMAIPVRIDALHEELAGKVGEIVPAADPQSRTFTIKIDIPAVPSLHSGLYGKARFHLGKKEMLGVPTTALVEKGQLVGIYVVDDRGAVRLRLVSTGKRYGGNMEILSGLTAGERIVVGGLEKISDGSRVAVPAETSERRP